MTGRTIITNALQEIGVLAQGETANADDAAAALAVLQRMVNSLGAERQAIFQVLRTVTTLVSGTRDYTIGSGGAINIVRPAYIDHATVILNSTLSDVQETPISILSDQDWEFVGTKTFDAGSIQGIYYDRAMSATGRGTISTYPTINIPNTQLVLYTPAAIVGFVDLTTSYLFPPGYEDAFHYDLSVRLQRPFGRGQDPDLEEKKGEAWARVKRANLSIDELDLDPLLSGGFGGWYNILTDD